VEGEDVGHAGALAPQGVERCSNMWVSGYVHDILEADGAKDVDDLPSSPPSTTIMIR
jgi:hypothetical protein